MAQQCEMTNETLATKENGPLLLEVVGSKTLCIETDGDANLTPYTATLRIRNTSPTPVILSYKLDPLRSFRSKAIWPRGRPDEAFEFSTCCAGAGEPKTVEETVPPQGTVKISSWTRHHDEIWENEVPEGLSVADLMPSDYTVRFDLAMSYDRGSGPVAVSETFDINLRAIPVLADDN